MLFVTIHFSWGTQKWRQQNTKNSMYFHKGDLYYEQNNKAVWDSNKTGTLECAGVNSKRVERIK